MATTTTDGVIWGGGEGGESPQECHAAADYDCRVELGRAILRYHHLYTAALEEGDLRTAALVVDRMVKLLGLSPDAQTAQPESAREQKPIPGDPLQGLQIRVG